MIKALLRNQLCRFIMKNADSVEKEVNRPGSQFFLKRLPILLLGNIKYQMGKAGIVNLRWLAAYRNNVADLGGGK